VSTDTVKRLVDVINEVFHATAVLGEGKPLQYRSLLQRLYITDVARREIERIEELQSEKGDLEQTVNGLKANISDLKTENSKLKTYTAPELTAALRSELADMREKCKQATPEMLQGLKIKVADLEAKLKEATKKLTEAERLNSYFLRNFKVLKGVFLEFSSLFGEVDAGYQKIIAEKQAQTPIEEKQETPVVAESAKEAAVIPVQVQPGTQKVEPNTPAELYVPTPASEQHQKVLSFLKNRPGKEFSAFELSLALGVPEQAVCEAIHVFDSEITVSPNGLSVKGNIK
jgi:cell division protein FtsB